MNTQQLLQESERSRLALLSILEDQKLTEAKLRKSEAYNRLLFNISPIGLALCKMDGSLIDVNPAYAKIIGRTVEETLKLTYWDITPKKYEEQEKQQLKLLEETGRYGPYEKEYMHKDGHLVPVQLQGLIFEQEGERFIWSSTEDITERKWAEEQIHRRSEELATLLKISQQLATTLDLETILQMTTDRVTELTELKSSAIYLLEGETLHLWATTPPLPPQFPEELRNAPLADHPHIRKAITTGMPVFLPDTATADLTSAERTVSEMRGLHSILYLPLSSGAKVLGTIIVTTIEKPRVLSDAEINLCNTFANMAALAVGNARLYKSEQRYAAHLEQSVVELKQSEEKVLKANRVYAVISQINQAIVRIRDKDKLFEECCNIAIDFGKFQMAWIGLVDEETKSVKPVTFSGVEDGYLTTIKNISVSDVPEGRGPIGTAIREGKHFICDDIENDLCMAVWKDEALKRGYRSSIVLPIKLSGKVIGAFSLYAPTPHFFDKAEINLLDEVTKDISFALETIGTEKKRLEAEEELKKSYEKTKELEAIINRSPAVAFLWRAEENWPVEYVSENISQFGYTPDELLSGALPFAKMVFSEDLEHVAEEVSHYSQTGATEFVQEYRIITKTGDIRWVDDRTRIRRDPNNNITHYEGIVSDITERKQAEEALLESESKFSEAFHNSPVALVILSLDGKFIDTNKSFCELVGYSREEVINKSITDLGIISTEDREKLIAAIKSSGESALNAEVKFRIRDGSYRDILYSTNTISFRGVPHRLSTGIDITARKRAEEELETQKHFISSVVDTSPAIIYVYDMESNKNVYINSGMERLLGYSSKEIHDMGENVLTDLLHPDDLPAIIELHSKIRSASDDDPLVIEYRMKNRQGEWRTLHSDERVFTRNTDGSVKQKIGIATDITERKQAEEEIRQRNREMEIIDAIIKSTTTRLELQAILDKALEGAMALTGLEGGTLCLVDNEKKLLDLAAAQNTSKEMFDELSAHSIGIGDCLCGKAVETGEPLILWDNASGSEYATHESVRNEGIRFHAAFPLISSGKSLGVLCVFARNEYKPTERALKMLEELCGTVALAIENAELYEKTIAHSADLESEIIERKRAEENLQDSREQLRQFASRLQSVREEESTRIAREIHDELGQALTGLNLDINWLEKRIPEDQTPIHNKLESMQHLIDSTIQTVRKISTELRPGVLELGLLPAIDWQAREFQTRTGIKCNFSKDVPEVSFDEEKSTNLFRMFQEILTNIMRHANATKVSINLKKEGNTFILEVQDNGKGITKEEVDNIKSLGILGMHERATLLGGSFDIRGIPKKGTKVTVKVPIRASSFA